MARAGAGRALATPYQSYDFLKLWHRHVGADGRHVPRSSWSALMPAASRCSCGHSAAAARGHAGVEFLGGKHANFNMALWRRDVAATIEADELRAVPSPASPAGPTIVAHQPTADVGRRHQPFRAAAAPARGQFRIFRRAGPGLRGAAARPHQCRRAQEDAQEGTHPRRAIGTVRFTRAKQRADDVRRVLDVFFKQKSARMRARGIAGRLRASPACADSLRRRRPNRPPAASRDRALRAFGRRHHRRDHGRHRRRRALLRHVQFDRVKAATRSKARANN